MRLQKSSDPWLFFSSLCHLWFTILALIINILRGTVFNFFVCRLINCYNYGEKLSQYATFQMGHKFYVEIKEILTFFSQRFLLICLNDAKLALSLLLLRLIQNWRKTDYSQSSLYYRIHGKLDLCKYIILFQSIRLTKCLFYAFIWSLSFESNGERHQIYERFQIKCYACCPQTGKIKNIL